MERGRGWRRLGRRGENKMEDAGEDHQRGGRGTKVVGGEEAREEGGEDEERMEKRRRG
jgi:hypothetical protein